MIIKNPKSIWDKILENKIDYPQSFLNRLPNEKWIFQRSLQQNEMFVLGLSDEDFSNAIQSNEKKIISNFLYKLRSIAYEPQIDLYFEHHLETQKNNNANAKISKRFTLIKSIGAFQKLNPKKIRLNNLGEVINFVDNNND